MYKYYINGTWVKSSKAKISFNDRGFLYGDGLFETLRFDNKKIFSYKKHLQRLYKSLKVIDLNIGKTSAQLFNLLKEVISNNNLNSGILRLMVTRGETNSDNPSIFISIKPFYKIPQKPVKVVYLDEKKFPIIRFNPAIKSMNYLGNMLAKKATEKLNAFEPIFFNGDNLITECAIRNIFYIRGEELFTPSINLGILPGVMRDTIINIAKDLNIIVHETNILYSEVNKMDEAFISSTGIGLLECYWNTWESNYLITKEIKKELFNRINKY